MTLPSYFAGLIPTVLGVGSTGSLGTTVEFWRSLQPKGGCDAEAKQSPGLEIEGHTRDRVGPGCTRPSRCRDTEARGTVSDAPGAPRPAHPEAAPGPRPGPASRSAAAPLAAGAQRAAWQLPSAGNSSNSSSSSRRPRSTGCFFSDITPHRAPPHSEPQQSWEPQYSPGAETAHAGATIETSQEELRGSARNAGISEVAQRFLRV